jgi:hypothetical protein
MGREDRLRAVCGRRTVCMRLITGSEEVTAEGP